MAKEPYNPVEFGTKWAEKWVTDKIYKANDESNKPKSYLLIEFPYPSGDRLHVGHARSYSCLDTVARLRRMKGMNVLFPFGWDAFGLPAENYAVKTGIHPAITTAANISHAKAQAISWGLSFDWDREINTTDPAYYKWTQWIFIQLFKKGLAYKKEIPVNWCPSCKINLANEEVIDGKCERCGTQTERRLQTQWLLKITEYADKLLAGLEKVNFREDIKLQQINWIGRKEGINIRYPIEGQPDQFVEVFTTRPDTNFGATFIVVAPEHELAQTAAVKNPEVQMYIYEATKKSELDRIAEGRKKTGVFTGLYAINNLNHERLPIWVSDFVLGNVGTGAVVGVPGHDRRDFEFAKEKGLPIKRVVIGKDCDTSEITSISQVQEDEGVMVHSEFLDGMDIHTATEKIMDYLEKQRWGKRVVSYHLRDWVFSRQHYWGEPIPMVWCPACAKASAGEVNAGWQPVAEDQLPVELPKVEKYQPSNTGESPLASMTEWVNTSCPVCGGPARRETDTMPNWAGSSWYYLRYIDTHNNSSIGEVKKLKYWLPVDWYNGGMEHTTLHLLYSRFWHKVLFDLGVVPTEEPYAKRTSHGVVLGPDGKRMSKSKGNVINPDDVVNKYGADTLRMYEMFIGPFDQTVVWSWESVEGVYKFLKKVWVLACENENENSKKIVSSSRAKRLLYRTIIKIESDLEAMKFNTAVSTTMEWVNWWADNRAEVGMDLVKSFILALAPMAPFLAEEVYQRLYGKTATDKSVHLQAWPTTEEVIDADEKFWIVVQVNGKVRGKLELPSFAKTMEGKDRVVEAALGLENVKKFVGEAKYRVVFVPGRLLNYILE